MVGRLSLRFSSGVFFTEVAFVNGKTEDLFP